MWEVTDRDEHFMYHTMGEVHEQQGLGKEEIQDILKQKDQPTVDLSPVEKSFSDLFKLLQKQKQVIKGDHMKNS